MRLIFVILVVVIIFEVNFMIDGCNQYLENVATKKGELQKVCTEQKWCSADVRDGIDYDYSIDRYDELETIKQELRLDISILERRN